MLAFTRDTQVPVIIALNTRDETSRFLDGHIEALRKERTLCQKSLLREYPGAGQKHDDGIIQHSHRPPITIPSELKLANPQRA